MNFIPWSLQFSSLQSESSFLVTSIFKFLVFRAFKSVHKAVALKQHWG